MSLFSKSEVKDESRTLDFQTRRNVAYLFAHTALIRIAFDFLSRNRVVVASDSHRFSAQQSIFQELSSEQLSQLLIMKSDLYESIEEEEFSSVIDGQLSDEELRRSLELYEHENHDLPFLNQRMPDEVFLEYLWILESPDRKICHRTTLKNLPWWNSFEIFMELAGLKLNLL